MTTRTLLVTGLIAAIGAGATAPAALADSTLGQHVASCAQADLGARADPPQVTCTHDGMTMTFPTFGAMVLHMQEMHAG